MIAVELVGIRSLQRRGYGTALQGHYAVGTRTVVLPYDGHILIRSARQGRPNGIYFVAIGIIRRFQNRDAIRYEIIAAAAAKPYAGHTFTQAVSDSADRDLIIGEVSLRQNHEALRRIRPPLCRQQIVYMVLVVGRGAQSARRMDLAVELRIIRAEDNRIEVRTRQRRQIDRILFAQAE